MTLEVDRAGRVVRRGTVALPAADAGGPHPVRGEGAGGGARPRRVHAAAVGHPGRVDGH